MDKIKFDVSGAELIRREEPDILPEDYDENEDYGFGMQHMLLYVGMLVLGAFCGAVGLGVVMVFFS